ncbi:MAG: DUF2490 domain-containing protein [Paludibacteraceae bacterium]|nr:DUF2490 domain-containing protein [Paludibacteraceae bacterium]
MRKFAFILLLFICIVVPAPLVAWEYESVETEKNTSLQLRTGAEFTKKFAHHVHLGISEELRFDLVPFGAATIFDRSFTTVSLSYAPIDYLKLDAGYMLKIIGAQTTNSEKVSSHWSDANEFIKHRVFFSISGVYKLEDWKFSIRERVLCDMRTDSVNPLEKNKYDWTLRHRLSVEYSIPARPIKTYAWIEFANTLNAPEYQQKYRDNNPEKYKGHQYLERIRTCVGVKYRVDKKNTLNFFYRLDYGYQRDINITKTKGNIELTEVKDYQNAIGFIYEFDW